MYELLSFGALLFVLRKLNLSKFWMKFLLTVQALWLSLGFLAGYDFVHAEYDIFPLHFAEVIKAVNINWVIITLYFFAAFLGVSLLTKFRPFDRKKSIAAALLGLVLTVFSMYQAYDVRPVYVKIKTRKNDPSACLRQAPPLDRGGENPVPPEKGGCLALARQGGLNLRIVFISDIHIGGVLTLYHLEKTMKIATDAEPDLLILGGDVFDGDLSFRSKELEVLKSAAKKAKYGAFAVNGNHEHYLLLDVDVEGIIRECGYDLLINERREVAGLTLLGLDDIDYGWIGIYLKPEDSERFVLVVKHRPGVPNDAEGKFDLQLSGHTHGGQFWPLGYFKNMALHSTQGLSEKAGGKVFVTNGAGFNNAMMRFFVPPEVVVIDIEAE